jgi:hypothetical protein
LAGALTVVSEAAATQAATENAHTGEKKILPLTYIDFDTGQIIVRTYEKDLNDKGGLI